MDGQRLQTFFFLSLLLGIFALVLFVFLPYASVIIIGGTLAVILHPLYRRILAFMPRQESLASLITVLISLAIFFVPVLLFGAAVARQAGNISLSVTTGKGLDFINETISFVQSKLHVVQPRTAINIDQAVQETARWVTENFGVIFSGVTNFLLGFLLTILALYYFLKDGKKLEETLIALSPLKDADDKEIFTRLNRAIRSVILGSLVVALVQGVLISVGFYIFIVPNAALWGAIGTVASLVPFIGTSLVIFPATIYLLATGNIAGGVGLALWGLTAVGLIDNVLASKLIGRGTRLHPLLILFSVLGGLSFFGATGFLIGPLVLSLLFALLDIYKKQLGPQGI
ncbi:AI-2E family transporter [Candidatus Azambacteria bacterium]|nr:AI-2E family transporter [Candidatus Azambacteria bacterium]